MRLPFRVDPFLVMLLATVGLANILPVSGTAATWLDSLTESAIALFFFLHGTKLSRAAIVAGAGAWRLHLGFLRLPLILPLTVFRQLQLLVRAGLAERYGRDAEVGPGLALQPAAA